MHKELEMWQFAAEKLERGEPLMLLVVAESAGSSPGRQGFKMAIAAGEMCGSIGGGVMEVKLVELAKAKIQNEQFKIDSEIVEQDHKKNSQNASGMICSGRQTVIFFSLNPEHLQTVREIVGALESHRSKTLRISDSAFQIRENEAEDLAFRFVQKSADEFLYEEKLGFKNRLFIVGGGHCALALSGIAAKLDFHISLFDDRAELNTLAKNRFVHHKQVIDSYENIGEFIPSGANHYVVVMTLGYSSDETVIRQLFDKNFKYFGVLGSRAKMKTLLKNLAKENFDEKKLSRIRTPVGLRINSRTPEEIAVSIAAEIIQIKNAA